MLPEHERWVVGIYYLREMRVSEIGARLGVSVNTIKSRLRRARRRLTVGHQRAGTYQTRSRAAYWDGRNTVG